MIIELKAKHFKGRTYHQEGCPLETAISEVINSEEIKECVHFVYIDHIKYIHKRFNKKDYDKLLLKAKELHYSNEILDKFKLIKYSKSVHI